MPDQSNASGNATIEGSHARRSEAQRALLAAGGALSADFFHASRALIQRARGYDDATALAAFTDITGALEKIRAAVGAVMGLPGLKTAELHPSATALLDACEAYCRDLRLRCEELVIISSDVDEACAAEALEPFRESIVAAHANLRRMVDHSRPS